MFDSTDAPASLDRICAATRAINSAVGERLVAIGELDTVRTRGRVADDRWAVDTFAGVAAELSGALAIGDMPASLLLRDARALRDRLPGVGALLVDGLITDWAFSVIVFRTELIEDAKIMAAVDATLAAKVGRWSTLSRGRLAGFVDKVVSRADRDAVRQRRSRQTEREVRITNLGSGLSEVLGRLVNTDAHALDARLDALAATVCDGDPRTRAQCRADALGALAVGAERLTCRCGNPGCPAVATPVPSPVVLYVIAEQASLDGTGSAPGSIVGSDVLVPPELLAELAATARVRPLRHPGDTPPERGYLPSAALSAFVRCRDLTCRFPGCDEPAIGCDVDHTIPFGDGGPTHAANLKALCRHHHLVKTFLGWRDEQLPDGTVIWRSPTGHTYVTTPGSAWIFPQLCVPTGPALPKLRAGAEEGHGDRAAMMPRRRCTRAQNRARYVAAERAQNRRAREATSARRGARAGTMSFAAPVAASDDDPPPF